MNKPSSKSREEAFSSIYKNHYWGTENRSGPGSSISATKVTRRIISRIIKDYKIKSIVDVACGDFAWMPLLLEELAGSVSYTGCDIVKGLVTQHRENFPQYQFQSLDFVEQDIPASELIICRDALQHLPINDIKTALENFSTSGAKYLLATTHIRRFGFRNRRDIKPGRCRDRNLLISPFNLPNPIVIYAEQYAGQDKFLGLWEQPFA